MRKLRIVNSLVIILIAMLLAIILFPSPAHAIANPDSITLYTVRAFQNVWEGDDILFVISYEVEYTTEPSEDASSSFQMAIYDTDGTTLIQARPLNYYQYNVHSIYFDATEAASLTWESNYVVRVMGNPIYFPMTEDTTMDSQVLSSYSWVEGSSADTETLLSTHCIDLAEDLEDAWALTLITSTPDGDVLNSTGGTVFTDAIPGLKSATPNLFQVVGTSLTPEDVESYGAYEQETSTVSQLGTAIEDAFDGIGDYFGVSAQTVAGAWIALFAFTVAAIVFLNSGNTIAAMILSIPIILIGMWVDAIPLALLFGAVIIIFLYGAYHIWLRGM